MIRIKALGIPKIKALGVEKIRRLGVDKVEALRLHDSKENNYKDYSEEKRKYSIVKKMFPALDLEKIFVMDYSKTINDIKTHNDERFLF